MQHTLSAAMPVLATTTHDQQDQSRRRRNRFAQFEDLARIPVERERVGKDNTANALGLDFRLSHDYRQPIPPDKCCLRRFERMSHNKNVITKARMRETHCTWNIREGDAS